MFIAKAGTLESRREMFIVIHPFFKRNVLKEGSCLRDLLSEKKIDAKLSMDCVIYKTFEHCGANQKA